MNNKEYLSKMNSGREGEFDMSLIWAGRAN